MQGTDVYLKSWITVGFFVFKNITRIYAAVLCMYNPVVPFPWRIHAISIFRVSLYLLQFLDGPVAIAAKQTTPQLSDTPTLLV